jgi:hypothetical protein
MAGGNSKQRHWGKEKMRREAGVLGEAKRRCASGPVKATFAVVLETWKKRLIFVVVAVVSLPLRARVASWLLQLDQEIKQEEISEHIVHLV